MPKTSIDVDRKVAGKMLGISVRTIDRYIRRGMLDARQENGRIWLNKKDIVTFTHPTRTAERTSIDRPQMTRWTSAGKQGDVSFYKDLYEEARRALGEYQQRLEQANYRIGTLESQILNVMPSKTNSYTENPNTYRDREIELLKRLAQKERISRIIFAILTYILLGALPLVWYFLR